VESHSLRWRLLFADLPLLPQFLFGKLFIGEFC
jgi:hypothetical protein